MAIIKGAAGNDTKTGTNLADTVYGYDGNDKLYGRDGADTIRGGNGDDYIWGENGNDTLYGEAGKDAVWGGSGNDKIYGGTGNDSLYGDAGIDTIYGEAGADIVKGGLGKSFLYGGADNDTLYYDPLAKGHIISYSDTSIKDSVIDGGTGYDTAHIYANALTGGFPALLDVWVQDNGVANLAYEKNGGMADQFIQAGTVVNTEHLVLHGAGGARVQTGLYGEGPMKVTGTEGKDMFFGGFGNETFLGGNGNDTFRGGGGADSFNGGAGSDSFVFDLATGGSAKITGFQVGVDDLYFDRSLLTNAAKQITYGTNKTTFSLEEDMVVTVDAVVKADDWHWIG